MDIFTPMTAIRLSLLRIIMVCLLALPCMPVRGQQVFPDSVVLDQRVSYNEYTHWVLPSINWLQQTPLGKDMVQRQRLDNFIMYWLQKNEEVVVTMPPYLINFQNVDAEFYFLYVGGSIKHALQTGDTTRRGNYLAGVESMLNYYEGNMGVRRDDYIDLLVRIRKQGKLASLYDTSRNAKNTHLYLRPPYSRHHFKPKENYFNFKYTAVNFRNPKGLQYRYMLDGYYNKWIYTTEQSVTFPNLPSGSYTFRVQVSIYPDFVNAVEDSYTFTIATPLWQKGWFLGLLVCLGICLIYLYMYQREKRLKNVAHLQQERILFEYENLKSQVNPHFLFNSLNTLTSLIEDNPEQAVTYTENLSDLYRNMLTHRSKDLVTLNEELEILENYIHIQKSRFGDALMLHLDIPEALLSKKIVPLGLQLLVENAIKHNIVSRTQPLVVTVTAMEDELVVTNAIKPKLSKEKGSGMGLANISKRYALATKRTISYGAVGDDYVVKLPLI